MSRPKQIDILAYFGWVWETSQYNASTSIKDDDAKVYLSLCSFGGDGIDLEQSRKKILYFLFVRWFKLLTREALTWFLVQDSKTRNKDQFDIREYVTCIDNSKWWE